MWASRWAEISGRIDRLERATAALFRSVEMVGSDYYGLSDSLLIPTALTIYSEMQGFRTAFGAALSGDASKALLDLLNKGYKVRQGPSGLPGIGGLVALLVTIRAEFESYVTDRELPGKRLVERAFLHLQRTIVADDEVASRWQRAFTDGERACEALGACHLLLHGIWAFKVSAAGEQTDLVLGERLGISNSMTTATEAMALTEWKLARTSAEAPQRAREAQQQAQLYAAGALAG